MNVDDADVVSEMFSCLYLNPSVRPGEYLQEHLNTSVFQDEDVRSGLSLYLVNPSCWDNADILGAKVIENQNTPYDKHYLLHIYIYYIHGHFLIQLLKNRGIVVLFSR